MPGRGLFDSLIVRGRSVLQMNSAAATETAGVPDGAVRLYNDGTHSYIQIYSLATQSWTRFAGEGVLTTTAVTGAVTLDATYHVVLADATSAAFTVTLPAAATNSGRSYHIKKVDASANAVTVDGNGAETIDGTTTKVITTQYDSIHIVCNGSTWHII